ncbi:MAG: DUF4864 domain-containing protein [Pyrinomonadaceae bacterium]
MKLDVSLVSNRARAVLIATVFAFVFSLAPQAVATKACWQTQSNTTKEPVAATEPSAQLSPVDVVNSQLKALQHNDSPAKDSGIATAFKFASPANRAQTGPLDHFVLLLKNPAYKPLLNHRSVEFGPVKIFEGVAHMRITLIDSEGARAVYVFILSKQPDGPCKDCWMTDGVMKIEEKQEERNVPIA